jgi:hypothetical protein
MIIIINKTSFTASVFTKKEGFDRLISECEKNEEIRGGNARHKGRAKA